MNGGCLKKFKNWGGNTLEKTTVLGLRWIGQVPLGQLCGKLIHDHFLESEDIL